LKAEEGFRIEEEAKAAAQSYWKEASAIIRLNGIGVKTEMTTSPSELRLTFRG
jgi:hypothetical protein